MTNHTNQGGRAAKESQDVFKPYKITTGLFAGITLPAVTRSSPRKKPVLGIQQEDSQRRLNQSIPRAGAEGIWLTNNPAFYTPYSNLRPPKGREKDREELGLG